MQRIKHHHRHHQLRPKHRFRRVCFPHMNSKWMIWYHHHRGSLYRQLLVSPGSELQAFARFSGLYSVVSLGKVDHAHHWRFQRESSIVFFCCLFGLFFVHGSAGLRCCVTAAATSSSVESVLLWFSVGIFEYLHANFWLSFFIVWFLFWTKCWFLR